MRFTIASEPTPGRQNEDYAIVGQDWAVVLDGATAIKPDQNGCIHDVTWLVHRLAGDLARILTINQDKPLTDALAEAIVATCKAHESTCDLDNPDSPSSTVTILRRRGEDLDYLVLGDSPLLLDRGGEIEAVTDDRMSNLTDYSYEAVIAVQNTPDGYYVASTLADAAYMSVHGTTAAAAVSSAVLLTDGAARLVNLFQELDWPGLLRALREDGPASVITRTRRTEEAEGPINDGRLRKLHDDVTAVLIDIQ